MIFFIVLPHPQSLNKKGGVIHQKLCGTHDHFMATFVRFIAFHNIIKYTSLKITQNMFGKNKDAWLFEL